MRRICRIFTQPRNASTFRSKPTRFAEVQFMVQRVMRRPEVEAVTGLKRSTIYLGMKRGTFPKPIPIGEKAVAWLEQDIRDWQNRRIAERDATANRK